jgi:hypothetical protein
MKILTTLCLLISFICLTACEETNTEKPYQLEISSLAMPSAGQSDTFMLRLTQHNKPVTPNDLVETHTKKLHVMSIDPSLTDYKHEHPTYNENTQLYEFTTTLNNSGTYRVIADIKPKDDDEHHYVTTTIDVPGTPKPLVWATLDPGQYETHKKVGNLNFTMQMDTQNVVAGNDVMLTIMITDDKQQPFTQLEPIMGAYAHLVGFNTHNEDLLHTHPMGEKPQAENDRGGPNVEFHLHFEKPGFYRLFAQFQVNGADVFVPFDVNVATQSI